jgi:transketolase
LRNVFIDTLIAEARNDDRIVLITADLGFGVVDKFEAEFPDRFFNMGIAEQSIMSIAAGLASQGLRPFVYSIGNFPTFRCMEQIRNDVSYMKNGVVIVALGAGFSYGTAGYSHYLIEDISSMRVFENISIYNPATSQQVSSITSLLCNENSPAYLRLGSLDSVDTSGGIDTGVSYQVVAEGEHGTVLTTGPLLSIALGARETLLTQGFSLGVTSVFNISKFKSVNLKNVFPSPLITLEEHMKFGGFFSIVLESLVLKEESFKLGGVGIESFQHSTIGKRSFMLDKYGITADMVVKEFNRLYELSNKS